MGKYVDLTGKRFTRLVVQGRANVPPRKYNSVRWDCLCDCGGRTVAATTDLNTGSVKSCGCLMVEKAQRLGEANLKHGGSAGGKLSGSYTSWASMRNRCRSTSSHAYQNYGGRGVVIDPRWDDYSAFLEDMGERPKGYTLGRIDNDKGYCKENCRWESTLQQNRNKRNVRLTVELAAEIKKDTRPQSVIAKAYGISQSAVSSVKIGRTWKDA